MVIPILDTTNRRRQIRQLLDINFRDVYPYEFVDTLENIGKEVVSIVFVDSDNEFVRLSYDEGDRRILYVFLRGVTSREYLSAPPGFEKTKRLPAQMMTIYDFDKRVQILKTFDKLIYLTTSVDRVEPVISQALREIYSKAIKPVDILRRCEMMILNPVRWDL